MKPHHSFSRRMIKLPFLLLISAFSFSLFQLWLPTILPSTQDMVYSLNNNNNSNSMQAIATQPDGWTQRRIPSQPLDKPTKAHRPSRFSAKQDNDRPDYHVVFSTSCVPQQHWESYLFFYHAWKVNQPGTVVRLCYLGTFALVSVVRLLPLYCCY